MTWRDLIVLVFAGLGVYGPASNIPASSMRTALLVLNGFIDYLGTQRLSMWTIQRLVFNLVANKQSYAMGPGQTLPNWDSPRPAQIYRAGVILNDYAPDYEKPLDIITDAQYAATRIKQLPSTFPTELFNDGANPASNIWFYPLPQIAYPVTLYVPQAVAKVDQANITDDLILPPGYQQMLEDGLTVRLANKFARPVTQEMKNTADASLLAVKSNNQPELRLRTPSGMRGTGGRWFDIYSGSFDNGRS